MYHDIMGTNYSFLYIPKHRNKKLNKPMISSLTHKQGHAFLYDTHTQFIQCIHKKAQGIMDLIPKKYFYRTIACK